MKRTPWLLASSLGFLALANVPVACVANTAAPPLGDDGGGLPPEDSGLLGEDGALPPAHDGSTPSDAAGPSDAGADTSTPDAAPQPVTLTALRLGAPEPGVAIVFQDATGAVLATATTDATGTVSQLVAAGSQVTAVFGTTTSPSLVTIQGIQPGDNLSVVNTSGTASLPPGIDVAVTLPTGTWDASTTAEYVYAGSCSQADGYALYLAPTCQAPGSFPLFARAVDDTSQQEIAYTYQTGNPLPDGGLPDGDTAYPFSLSRPWITPSAAMTITAANPPALPDDAGGASTANDVQISYSESAGGVTMASPSSSGDTIDDAGTQTIDYVVHAGFPDFVQAEALDRVNTSAGVLVAAAATRTAAPSSAQTTSLDLSTLPLILATSIAVPDGGTSAQPTVTWTSAGSLAAANGIFISAQWYSALTDGGDQSTYGTWTVLAPPSATSIQPPALPPSLAAWGPASNAEFNRPRIGAVQASFLTGYAGLRAAFAGLPFLSGYQLSVPTLPVNGTLYLVGIYQDEG